LALPEHVGQDAILMMRIDNVELLDIELLGVALLVVTSFIVGLLGYCLNRDVGLSYKMGKKAQLTDVKKPANFLGYTG